MPLRVKAAHAAQLLAMLMTGAMTAAPDVQQQPCSAQQCLSSEHAAVYNLPNTSVGSLGQFLPALLALKSDDDNTTRECPRVQYISSEHEHECYETPVSYTHLTLPTTPYV